MKTNEIKKINKQDSTYFHKAADSTNGSSYLHILHLHSSPFQFEIRDLN